MKISHFLILLFLASSASLLAAKNEKSKAPKEYFYEETIHIPLPESVLASWKVIYKNTDKKGIASTRYVLQTESADNWTQLLNIQFRDKKRIPSKDALEAMNREASFSKQVTYKVIKKSNNDLLYERIFPSGEHEIVRMIMTEKGLHRIAYVRKGKFPDEEKTEWLERLSKGVVRGKED